MPMPPRLEAKSGVANGDFLSDPVNFKKAISLVQKEGIVQHSLFEIGGREDYRGKEIWTRPYERPVPGNYQRAEKAGVYLPISKEDYRSLLESNPSKLMRVEEYSGDFPLRAKVSANGIVYVSGKNQGTARVAGKKLDKSEILGLDKGNIRAVPEVLNTFLR